MNVKVIHAKMMVSARTWEMDMSVHVKRDLVGLTVKQVKCVIVELNAL